MNLRPYQRAAIDAVRECWDKGEQNALVVLPTGTGKTVVFCTLGREVRMEGIGKVVVLAHMDKLLDQAREKWLAVDPEANVGIYQGARRESWADVICASVQSCYPDVVDADGNVTRRGRINDLPLAEIGLVIVDEAHRIEADTYVAIIDKVREANPAALVLLVTATPARNDGKTLGRWVNHAAYRLALQDAIDMGFLAPLRGCRVELDLDFSTVKTSKQTGDYQENDLGRAMDSPAVHQSIVKTWLEKVGPGTFDGGQDGRFTVSYSPTTACAENLAAAFREAGVSAEHVHGKMPKKHNDSVLESFQKKQLRVVCNVAKLTEGWDAQHIGCVIVGRPTKSGGLYRQIVGRGTRPLGRDMQESIRNGKADCIIMDCVGANALGLHTLIDLSSPKSEHIPGIDPDPEPDEEELVLDKDAKQLDLPELAQTIQVRGCTVYDIDLFGGQVVWTRIRGMRLAILDIGLHIVLYQEPNGGAFTAMLVDETAAIPFCKNRPERECLAEAEQMAMVRGRAKYLKPNKFQARMPATEKQMLNIQRLTAQNVALGGLDARDVPEQMSMPQAMAWIAYLKTRRMWMKTRAAAQGQRAGAAA